MLLFVVSFVRGQLMIRVLLRVRVHGVRQLASSAFRNHHRRICAFVRISLITHKRNVRVRVCDSNRND